MGRAEGREGLASAKTWSARQIRRWAPILQSKSGTVLCLLTRTQLTGTGEEV